MSAPHPVRRPQWTCAVDGEAWPCAPARRLLRKEFATSGGVLTAYMSALMASAADDLGETDLRGLYRRFVRWALPDDSRCRVCGRGGHDAIAGIPPRLIPCDGLADVARGQSRPPGEHGGKIPSRR